MDSVFLELGIGSSRHVFSARRVVGIMSYQGLAVRALKRQKELDKKVIDARAGYKTKSLVVLDTGEIVLSPRTAEALFSVIQHNGEDSEAFWNNPRRGNTGLRKKTRRRSAPSGKSTEEATNSAAV